MFKTTPDLSKEFNPTPKPNAKLKAAPKPIPQIGKKGKANIDANKKMYKMFEELGITTCELELKGCWRNNALGYVHAKKRRFLSESDLTEGLLGCVICHNQIEYLPHIEMEKIVKNVIKNRK